LPSARARSELRSCTCPATRGVRLFRIGYLHVVAAFRRALDVARRVFCSGCAKLGYVEGRNLTIEYRSARVGLDGSRPLPRSLPQPRSEVIFANDTETALAVKRAGVRLPVIAHMHEPVALGFVKSLARPAATFTGLSSVAPELAEKRLELFQKHPAET